MQDVMNSWKKYLLSESSLSRVFDHIQEHDCAVITAFRNDPDDTTNCLKSSGGSTEETDEESEEESEDLSEAAVPGAYDKNMENNRELKATLLEKQYGVTKVKGSYIENFMQKNSIEVQEESLFVVNLSDDPEFVDTIIELGKRYCQDSVLIIPQGGSDAYLHGTNNAEYPGLDKKQTVGDFKAGNEEQYMTKVSGRPFTFKESKEFKLQTMKDFSRNGRWAIKVIAERARKRAKCL